jgi:hypothetical protein
MTPLPDGILPATPTAIPPVRQATVVRSDIRHTFDTFVRKIGSWWPVLPISVGHQRVRHVAIEPLLGGRVYETWDDDTIVDWGAVTVWEPPHRFVMSWTSTPATTEVEFTFRPLGPALTRVAVEHRGWEALTDEQLGEDCAAPGGYRSGAYAHGWRIVLERLTAAAQSDTPPSPQETDR